MCSIHSREAPSVIGVSIDPGATMFTVMPCSATSRASARVKPWRAIREVGFELIETITTRDVSAFLRELDGQDIGPKTVKHRELLLRPHKPVDHEPLPALQARHHRVVRIPRFNGNYENAPNLDALAPSIVDTGRLIVSSSVVHPQKGSPVMNTLKPLFKQQRACSALLIIAVCSSLAFFAAAAGAAPSSSTDPCVGLECDTPASGTYVPEAQDVRTEVSGLDQLLAQTKSGFYTLPALVYRGDVQPKAVVYLAKAGDFAQMPTSVRNLPAVQDLLQARGSDIDATTFVVVDHGIRIMAPPESAAAASHSVTHHPRARAAVFPSCRNRFFCLYQEVSWLGRNLEISGVEYAGTEWHNLGTNFGSSQMNPRAGDTLLADHALGEGTRYCAQQDLWIPPSQTTRLGTAMPAPLPSSGERPIAADGRGAPAVAPSAEGRLRSSAIPVAPASRRGHWGAQTPAGCPA